MYGTINFDHFISLHLRVSKGKRRSVPPFLPFCAARGGKFYKITLIFKDVIILNLSVKEAYFMKAAHVLY